MAEELTPPNILPFSRQVWLVKELARSDNKLEIQKKYKRVFGDSINNSDLDQFSQEHAEDVRELKAVNRKDIDSHEMADPYKRMDLYKDIYTQATEGVCVGLDKEGNLAYKEDLASAIKALIQCREEQQTVTKNEMEMLKLLIASKQVLVSTPSQPEITVESEPVPQIETDVTGTKQFFNFDND